MVGKFLSNRRTRVYLDTLAEVSGPHGFPTVLTLGGLHNWLEALPPYNDAYEVDFADFGALNVMLVRMYGPRAGWAMMQWAGRVSFMNLTSYLESLLPVRTDAFQAQSPAARTQAALEVITANSHLGNIQASLQVLSDQFLCTLDPCPFCYGQNHTTYSVCHGAIGFLRQAIEWVGAGDHYMVEEISCAATKGSQDTDCVFVFQAMELHNDR